MDPTILYDQIPEPVFLVHPSGRIEYVNRATERLLGYDRGELAGVQMLDLVCEADRDRTIAEAQRVMAGQARLGFENRYRHRQGHSVVLAWSARRLELEGMRLGLARQVQGARAQAHDAFGQFMQQAQLAPHEQRVLRLLMSEATEKQIAEQLGLAVSTTHSYVTAIYRKTGVRSRAALMSRCLLQLMPAEGRTIEP